MSHWNNDENLITENFYSSACGKGNSYQFENGNMHFCSSKNGDWYIYLKYVSTSSKDTKYTFNSTFENCFYASNGWSIAQLV